MTAETAVPIRLTLARGEHVADGGDGAPWTRWALVCHTDEAAAVIVTAWAKDDAPMDEVLSGVFASLRQGGGLFGG